VTSLALKNSDDYPGAAKKHLDDAHALIAAKRFDGAGYLTGYVVECALRTVVLMGEFARYVPLGPGRLEADLKKADANKYVTSAAKVAKDAGRDHDLFELAKVASGYTAVLRGHSAVYAPSIDTTKPPFGAWTFHLRYHTDGRVLPADAAAWLAAAELLYLSTIGAMQRNRWIFS
jgi:hypothetical protein